MLPMFAVSVCLSVRQSVRQSVCLSRGSPLLHCAKMAEQIKMLFGVNTPGVHETLCYMWVLIPPERGRGPLYILGPPPISGTAKARGWKFCMHRPIERWRP